MKNWFWLAVSLLAAGAQAQKVVVYTAAKQAGQRSRISCSPREPGSRLAPCVRPVPNGPCPLGRESHRGHVPP